MKKILFLLLLITSAAQAQTTLANKLKITGNVENTTPAFIGTQETDGLVNKIPSAYIEKTANKTSTISGYSETLYPNEKATHDALDAKLNLSDLPSNLTLYATNVPSGVSTYTKWVASLNDPDYNTTAVDIPTGAISGTAQLISGLSSIGGVITGNPGIINVTTVGNIRRTSGTGTAKFYFELYKRTSAGVETLLGVSDFTLPVDFNTYSEFSATAVWNDGVFTETDRIVIKFYGSRIAGGGDPTFDFQFGGLTPVRTIVPVPFRVVAGEYELKANKQNSLAVDGTGIKYPTVDATNAGLALKANDNNAVHLNGAETITGLKTIKDTYLKIVNDNVINPRGLAIYQNFTGAPAPTANFYKSRGTHLSPVNSLSGDLVGLFTFNSYISGGYSSDKSLFGATMSSSTGISQFFISGNTNGNYVPNLLIHENKKVAIGALGGNVLSSLTPPSAMLQVKSLGTTTDSALLIQNSASTNLLDIKDNGVVFIPNKVIVSTLTDNGQGVGQFNGNVTFSDGTLSNHGVTKSQLDLKADLTNTLLLTGNQTLTGVKTIINSDAIPSSITLTNNNTTTGSTVASFTNSNTSSDNLSSGAIFRNSNSGVGTSAIRVENEVGGLAVRVSNLGTGTGYYVTNWSTGVSAIYDSRIDSTGDLIEFTKQGVLTGKVNSNGEATLPKLTMTGTIDLKSYTVSTLPTGIQGATAYVTDALAPTYLSIVVGGGDVVAPVFYNGTNWVSH